MACKFNGHLHCTNTDPKRLNGCRRCGWNPEVAQRRKFFIEAAMAWERKRAAVVKVPATAVVEKSDRR